MVFFVYMVNSLVLNMGSADRFWFCRVCVYLRLS